MQRVTDRTSAPAHRHRTRSMTGQAASRTVPSTTRATGTIPRAASTAAIKGHTSPPDAEHEVHAGACWCSCALLMFLACGAPQQLVSGLVCWSSPFCALL